MSLEHHRKCYHIDRRMDGKGHQSQGVMSTAVQHFRQVYRFPICQSYNYLMSFNSTITVWGFSGP